MKGTKWSRGKKNQGPKAKARRKGALGRLEEQLKSGNKTNYHIKNPYVEFGSKIPLEEKDKKRITKEINILKERV